MKTVLTRAAITVGIGRATIRNFHSSLARKEIVQANMLQDWRPFVLNYIKKFLVNDPNFYFPLATEHLEHCGNYFFHELQKRAAKGCTDSAYLFEVAQAFKAEEIQGITLSQLGDPLDYSRFKLWIPLRNVGNATPENIRLIHENFHAILTTVSYAHKFLGGKTFTQDAYHSTSSFDVIESDVEQGAHRDGILHCDIARESDLDAIAVIAGRSNGAVKTFLLDDYEVCKKLSPKSLQILQKKIFYFCRYDNHTYAGTHLFPPIKFPIVKLDKNGQFYIADFNADLLENNKLTFDDPATLAEEEVQAALLELYDVTKKLARDVNTPFAALKTGEALIFHHNLHGRYGKGDEARRVFVCGFEIDSKALTPSLTPSPIKEKRLSTCSSLAATGRDGGSSEL